MKGRGCGRTEKMRRMGGEGGRREARVDTRRTFEIL